MYRIFWLRNKLLRETSKEENGMQDREKFRREYEKRTKQSLVFSCCSLAAAIVALIVAILLS